MTGEDGGEDVGDIVDAAVERADDGPDVFNPLSCRDYIDRRVADDHDANQVLHDALKAAAKAGDPELEVVNLMASHASHGPERRAKGEPRYNVRAKLVNEGMGHAVIGNSVVGSMVERGDVRIVDVAGHSDDHLEVILRPIITTVEPVEVRVDDIPGHVFEDRVDRVPLCSTYECTNDAACDRRYQFENGFTVDIPLCRACDEHVDAEGWEDVTIDDGIPARPPKGPLRDWVEDRTHLFTGDPDPDYLADIIADAIADVGKADEPQVDPNYTATTDEIESFRADFDAEYDPRDVPDATVFGDFVPYSRRREGRPTVHVALQDKDDGSLVAQVDAKAEEWEEVDTGRGIYNVRVDVGAKKAAAKPVTAYVCHGCERKTLPEDFVTHGGVDGPACPRCGTAVDWDKTHADQVGADE